MSLNLDTRQRAMLQEMGHPLWWPESAVSAPADAAVDQAESHKQNQPVAPASQAQTATENIAIHTPPAPVADAPPERPQAAPRPAPAPPAAIPQDFPRVRFALGAPVLLDLREPSAQTEPAPAATQPAWLLVAELPGATPPQCLASPAGQLAIRMLRAMGLGDAAVYWAPLARIAPGQPDTDDLPDYPIDALVHDCKPCMAVLLGLPAARHLVGGTQSLVQLRQHIHPIGSQQLPAIVSYDPSYLLRTPRAKGDTWADLCRALAHAGR